MEAEVNYNWFNSRGNTTLLLYDTYYRYSFKHNFDIESTKYLEKKTAKYFNPCYLALFEMHTH